VPFSGEDGTDTFGLDLAANGFVVFLADSLPLFISPFFGTATIGRRAAAEEVWAKPELFAVVFSTRGFPGHRVIEMT